MASQPMLPAPCGGGATPASRHPESTTADEQQDATSLLPSPPAQNHEPAGPARSLGARCDAAEEVEKGEKWLKEMRGSLLVVASLLASVTYQAGMNPPGGLWQDSSPEGSGNPHRAGDPVLADTDAARFTLFTAFNSFAFAYAIGTMMQLLMDSSAAAWTGGPRRFMSFLGFGNVRTMRYMMVFCLLYLGVAFAAGSSRNWRSSLGAMFVPLCYFLSCFAFDRLYATILRKREREEQATAAQAQQVEVAVENHRTVAEDRDPAL